MPQFIYFHSLAQQQRPFIPSGAAELCHELVVLLHRFNCPEDGSECVRKRRAETLCPS